VYKAKWHGSYVAAKVLKRSDEIALGDFRTEIAILRKIHHPNCVQVCGRGGGAEWARLGCGGMWALGSKHQRFGICVQAPVTMLHNIGASRHCVFR
jgi:hypothetical protein